ncbi:hypothetical protein GPJ56_002572 [Histomonas meleagridis]|uniref:uncharacterized protein n=1 Tax=Histomonas meleagridis TaxID=135588 RepID=UPI00355A8468|nr:hypothetical protein GPJ56_002572 [Histomonas meleagridis]KAH0801364.1 hypothetical protein GO595_005959 [Histomonas meleagridis]
MENPFHFGLKVAVIGQSVELVRKFVESVPGVEMDPSETFHFLKVFTFPLYISDSIILRIDLWALPEDVKQKGDAQLLCCDASIVFYIASTESDMLSLLSVFHRDVRAANSQCLYICCGNLSEGSLNALGKASGFEVQKVENMDPENIAHVFKSAIVSIINQIPNPPDPVFFLHKNIKLGSLLIQDPLYLKSLRPNFPQ